MSGVYMDSDRHPDLGPDPKSLEAERAAAEFHWTAPAVWLLHGHLHHRALAQSVQRGIFQCIICALETFLGSARMAQAGGTRHLANAKEGVGSTYAPNPPHPA